MLNKTIILDGREVGFTLTRNPRAKHLKVRILPDCTVKVTSPPGLSVEYIESFLLSRSGAILAALDKYSAASESSVPFGTGCTVLCLGKPYTVEIAGEREKPRAQEDGDRLIIYADGGDQARLIAEKWLAGRLRGYIAVALARYYPAVGALGVGMPDFSIKKMTSRWGSCSGRTHRLAFSLFLAEYPEEAVDYVVMHELAHFIHPNHSRDFYAFIARHMPDWKRRSDMLKMPRKNMFLSGK